MNLFYCVLFIKVYFSHDSLFSLPLIISTCLLFKVHVCICRFVVTPYLPLSPCSNYCKTVNRQPIPKPYGCQCLDTPRLLMYFLLWLNTSRGPGPPHSGFCITHIGTVTLGRIPLDGGSARRRDLHLTKHNTHNRHIHVSGGIFFLFCLCTLFYCFVLIVLALHFVLIIQTSLPPAGFEPAIPASDRPLRSVSVTHSAFFEYDGSLYPRELNCPPWTVCLPQFAVVSVALR